MRAALLAALLLLPVTEAPLAPAPTDVEKLAALARLYGVVRWFHPSDAARELDWSQFATYAARSVIAARTRDDVQNVLESLVAPVGAGIVVGETLPPASPVEVRAGPTLVAWRHLGMGFGSDNRGGPFVSAYVSARAGRRGEPEIHGFETLMPRVSALEDIELGLGLRARVPLVLTDAQASGDAGQRKRLDTLRAELERLPADGDTADPGVRAADVIVAWCVYRHFYPYWTEVGGDWDTRLAPLLAAGLAAGSREAHRDVIRSLVAEVHDGHGRVVDRQAGRQDARLPIAARWLDGQLVVTASTVPKQVEIGDIMTRVGGRPSAGWFKEQEALTSGSPQWRAVSALFALHRAPEGARIALDLDRQGAAVQAELAYSRGEPVHEPRPDPVAEIKPGVWYVDLERAKWEAVEPRLWVLARARAVVFDVRGYPSDAGFRIVPHLAAAPEHDRWMHVPQIVAPFGAIAGWEDRGWNIPPAAPHIAGKVAFLTDARAISYAESVMGYVEALGLPVVGGPTAGTNGNVNTFMVPSGMSVAFTGMRVTRHDGSAFHLAGVRPTVPVTPTLAGIRAGRDEVLERALAHLGVGDPAAP